MPVPDRETIVALIERGDRDIRCRLAIEEAWATVKSKYDSLAWFRRKSTARALMWEYSVQGVIAALQEDRDIRAVPHHDTVSFIIQDKVLMRLKKADNQLVTKNYPTPLAGLFHRHERDLFGHQGHQRVELVHVFNPLQTNLLWIGLVARDEKRNVLWEHELRSGGATILELPTAPRPAPAADTVLRPTKPEIEKREKEEE
ncbi:MAG TPA: hypothetical protein VF662_10790 [Allosphingosinicella sp.]|jgi:hypothetical protein